MKAFGVGTDKFPGMRVPNLQKTKTDIHHRYCAQL